MNPYPQTQMLTVGELLEDKWLRTPSALGRRRPQVDWLT